VRLRRAWRSAWTPKATSTTAPTTRITSYATSEAVRSAVRPNAATRPQTKTPVSLPSTVRKPDRRLCSDCLMIRTVLGPGEAATRVQAPRKAMRVLGMGSS